MHASRVSWCFSRKLLTSLACGTLPRLYKRCLQSHLSPHSKVASDDVKVALGRGLSSVARRWLMPSELGWGSCINVFFGNAKSWFWLVFNRFSLGPPIPSRTGRQRLSLQPSVFAPSTTTACQSRLHSRRCHVRLGMPVIYSLMGLRLEFPSFFRPESTTSKIRPFRPCT